MISRLQELARKKRLSFYLVWFINLTKAYDSLDRTLIWRELARFGVPQKILSVIRLIPRWHASMRTARRQGVQRVVRCETGPSSMVLARTPPVQHLLRGGSRRGLHAFQGGQRHHGRFGASEEENGGGGGQLAQSQSWRRRFGAFLTLTIPESSHNHPSS